jgi:predicted transcriptional regulator
MENKTKLMNFRIDEGLKNLLEECARKTRQPKSRLVREAIIKEIDRIKREK